MKNIFYVPKNTRQYDAVVEKLRLDLKELRYGDAPEEEVLEYVNTLLTQFTRFEPRPEYLFLQLDDPRELPSDIRVMYVYTPTYLALAILSYSMLEFESVRQIPGIKEVIRDVMNASTGRHFRGHGFDAPEGQVETMEIFAMGHVDRFIKRFPEINPEFNAAFDECVAYLEDGILDEIKESCFGCLTPERVMIVLEQLD